MGGGISGLAAAGFLANSSDCLLIEREAEVGGYCRTISRNGFVWDYSGHFFHFRNASVADYVCEHIDRSEVLTVEKKSSVYLAGNRIDAPLQFHIDQLPKQDFLRCLAEIYDAQKADLSEGAYESFLAMLYGRYGSWLTDEFFRPYNEKLYGIALDRLDREAMGRFFPHIDFDELLLMLSGRQASQTYNQNFSYHRRGAKAYVEALECRVPQSVIRLETACEAIDPARRLVRTSRGEERYDRLIVTGPLPQTLEMAGMGTLAGELTANKVLVFNLGFDGPSPVDDHWIYFPEADYVFYRVGFYDNILGQDRMSLYVEISLEQGAEFSEASLLERTLEDLTRIGIIGDHRLVDHETVLMDPAYVHVTREAREKSAAMIERLEAMDIHSIGRFGRWIYCSIEDNILGAYETARKLGAPECPIRNGSGQ